MTGTWNLAMAAPPSARCVYWSSACYLAVRMVSEMLAIPRKPLINLHSFADRTHASACWRLSYINRPGPEQDPHAEQSAAY